MQKGRKIDAILDKLFRIFRERNKTIIWNERATSALFSSNVRIWLASVNTPKFNNGPNAGWNMQQLREFVYIILISFFPNIIWLISILSLFIKVKIFINVTQTQAVIRTYNFERIYPENFSYKTIFSIKDWIETLLK